MPQILCGGYSDPFAPFTDPATGMDIGVDPDAPQLQLFETKLAPRQDDRWVVGATWGQSGDPEGLPAIAGGAIAWRDESLQYQSQTWDGNPLPEDPRSGGAAESWGARRPRWIGHGCYIGDDVFPKESNVTISDPSTATLSVQLPPGTVVIPGAIAGIARYDKSDIASVLPLPPAPESIPGLRQVTTNFGLTYYGGAENFPFDPIEFGQQIAQGLIVFEVFHPGQTVAQVQANTSRPSADTPDRDPVVGDLLAINLTYEITFQGASAGYTYDEEGDLYVVGALPEGTWERWVYTVPPGGERVVQDVAIAPTQNYGLTVTGVEGETVTQTGDIHQLLWHYDTWTLLTGTWSFSRATTKTGEASKGRAKAGPAHGDADSPGGAGFSGWPSGADGAAADAGFWDSKQIPVPGFGYFWPTTEIVTLTWPEWGITFNTPWLKSEYISEPGYTETVTYDSRQGNNPDWEVIDGATTDATVFGANANWAGDPQKNTNFEGRGPGITSYTLAGPSPPCWTTPQDKGPGPTHGGWLAGPTSGSCQVWVQWVHGAPETQTFQRKERVRTGTPVSPPPDPNDFPDLPGSGVPGGGAPGSDPPGFGYPPELFPDSSWDHRVSEITEYEIQSAVGPTLRSRRYFRLSMTDTSNHTADWDGSRAGSSITSGAATVTYELEHETPYAMIARSPINSASDTPEEALYLVRTLNPTAQTTEFATPYPYDTQTVFYQKSGETPVAIAGNIEALFPAIAWADPEQYIWDRYFSLQDGVLYRYPAIAPETDFRDSNQVLSVEAYQVDDGSLNPLQNRNVKVRSLDDGGAIIFDLSAG